MRTPTFGIFDHIEGLAGTDTAQVLRDRLDLVRIADQAGFTGFYLAEHHGSDLCLAPNQEMVIAAASQITSSIRMGPMVKLLPLHHPVRIIEDMCIVDNLTNGRLEFGVGRGVAPIEHYWFGSDWPNASLQISYAGWVSLVLDSVSDLAERERDRVMRGTALEVYARAWASR